MSRLRTSVLANFGGQAWSALVGVAFVPIYIRALGIEAYGLIGFFISLQAFVAILDMGLSATLNRELARHRYAVSEAMVQRDLVRTLECLYWPMGVLIAVGVFAISDPVAAHWLKPVALSRAETAHAVALMGLALGLQWPSGFYAGGFRGLERQIAINGLNAFFATLRSGGAAVVLLYFSATIEAFLWWQVGVSLLQTLVSGAALWRLLPPGPRAPAFQLGLFRGVFAYARGLAAIGVTSFLLSQADRILLSTLLPLSEFGYYTLAATIAAALSTVVQPFFQALYPRFSGLVAAGDRAGLERLYRQSTQLLATTVSATAAVMAFFAEDLLRLWTHDPVVAARSGAVLSVLVSGTALSAALFLPYALQLAHGRTRLNLALNVISALIVLPAIWWFGSRYGGLGAAAVWVALNLGYIAIGVPLMHDELIETRMSDWYLRDLLPPAIAAIAAAGMFRLLIPAVPDSVPGVLMLAGVGVTTLAIAGLCSPAARALLEHRRLA